MQKVTIVSQFFGTSGYASHTRQLARALHDVGVDVHIDTQGVQGWERTVDDTELSWITKKTDIEDRTMIFIGVPPFWRMALADNPKRFIGFLVWEGSKIPDYWLPYLLDERVDQIWVPSHHVKEAIHNTFANAVKEKVEEIEGAKFASVTELKKVRVVPHGVNPKLFKPQEKKERPFTFLCNKGWNGSIWDRGGLQYAMRAFKEEFKKEENVRMLVKINPAYIPHPDKKAWLHASMGALGLPEDGATLQITFDEIPYNKLPEFYGEGDVLVNSTRCEGFGLPGLEAHACGLMTISTGFGGQLDYMSEFTDLYTDYTLEEVKQDIMYEGISWGVPSIAHLRKQMRWCFTYPELVAEKGSAAVKATSEWSWAKTGEKALKCLGELSE